MLRDESWSEAARIVRGDVRGLASVHDDLVNRWGEPHRRYHDLRHLDDVVAALTELRSSTLSRPAQWADVVLAAWFHDAVYDVATPETNERFSAVMARTLLSCNGVDADTVQRVASLIEDTVAHDVAATSGPRAAFQDADLWILAAPRPRFDDYCADVRREYAAVPDDAYAAGRTVILAPLLERSTIYRTEHARLQWESRARVNLRRELDRLAR